MEASFELYPCLSVTAAIPVDVEQELAIQEQLGTVIRCQRELVEASFIYFHQRVEIEAEMILLALRRSGQERNGTLGDDGARESLAHAHERTLVIGVAYTMALGVAFTAAKFADATGASGSL